jgi:hypothetical protein
MRSRLKEKKGHECDHSSKDCQENSVFQIGDPATLVMANCASPLAKVPRSRPLGEPVAQQPVDPRVWLGQADFAGIDDDIQ